MQLAEKLHLYNVHKFRTANCKKIHELVQHQESAEVERPQIPEI
jgi:hypothetical protein